jgi:hypothetical protein
VQVAHAQYRYHEKKPYYALTFSIIEPKHLRGCRMSGRVYCTPKALWQLNWFLRDFAYDPEMLSRGEVNDHLLVGLAGVVKVSYAIVRGMFYLNFDAFFPAEQRKDLSPIAEEPPKSELG